MQVSQTREKSFSSRFSVIYNQHHLLLVSNFYRSSSRHSSMSVGSGSILEALRLPRDKHRVLVVVVNETLMDNHQQELAFAMQDYLIPCTCS
jgi:hypothetical protein